MPREPHRGEVSVRQLDLRVQMQGQLSRHFGDASVMAALGTQKWVGGLRTGQLRMGAPPDSLMPAHQICHM